MNIITRDDKTLEYNYAFKNNFELKPFQKATIQKMVDRENNHRINVILSKRMVRNIDYYNSQHNNSHFRLNDFTLNNYRHEIDTYEEKYNLNTNIGILANNVGSGKTSVIMGLIKYKNTIHNMYSHNQYMKELLYNNIISFSKDLTNLLSDFCDPNINFNLMTYSDKQLETNMLQMMHSNDETINFNSKFLNTNLIIIPHNLIKQWESELLRLTDFNIKKLNTIIDFRSINFDNLEEYFNQYDIVLCNANKLRELHTHTEDYVWSRIFIDEADTIKIPHFPKLQSKFLWLISTTYERILNPKNKGFIHSLFNYDFIYDNKPLRQLFLDSMTITCDLNYINEYMKIQNPRYNFMICETPFINKSLYKLESRKLSRYLNTNNYSSIFYYLNHTRQGNWSTFVRDYIQNSNSLLINETTMDISELQPERNEINLFLLYILLLNSKIFYYKNMIQELNHQEPTEYNYYNMNVNNRISTYINKYHIVCKKLEYIKYELLYTSTCIFCHEKIQRLNKKNTYTCIGCINQDIHIQLFRTYFHFFDELDKYDTQLIHYKNIIGVIKSKRLKLGNIFKHDKQEEIKMTTVSKMFRKVKNGFFHKHNDVEEIKEECISESKLETLLKLVKQDKIDNKKVLIFSDSTNYFNVLSNLLNDNNILFRILKGNPNTINKILRDYTNNKFNVLLLNMKFMGAGLNLQMSAKIYIVNHIDEETQTQVIGRANRYGREGILDVNYIFYSEEKEKHIHPNEIEELTSDSDSDY